MRVGILSDLHVDDSPSGVVETAARSSKAESLVIAGDIASGWRKSLARNLDGAAPPRTVAVTHVVSRLDLTVQPPEGIWTYFNGLLGAASYGALFVERGIRAAICGHVHYRRRFTSDGVEWICACLGTPGEWATGGAIIEARAAMEILEVD